MSNIDNHMDELFQEASDKYPLKIKVGNFDELLPLVESPMNSPSTLAITKRKSVMLLFLLLIVGGILGSYLLTINSTTKLPITKKINGPVNENIGQINDNQKTSNESKIAWKDNERKSIQPIDKVTKTFRDHQELPVAIKYRRNDNNISASNKYPDQIINGISEKDLSNIPKENENENKIKQQPISITDVPNQPQEKNVIELKAATKKVETKEITSGGKKTKNKLSIYYGLIAGLEFNEVKNQEISKHGFNGGFILGLNLNQQIAIEGGLMLSQKKYFSVGKYFSPKSGSMPTNMKVTSLNGSCTVIEIPVALKYNFSKNKNTLFGKAGLSSYLLTKEKNQYQTMVNGQQKEINSIYNNSTYYGNANINLSVGYLHRISKQYNFRVEPYVQIPIKGIGIGSMPITTFGVRIGLIHFSQ